MSFSRACRLPLAFLAFALVGGHATAVEGGEFALRLSDGRWQTNAGADVTRDALKAAAQAGSTLAIAADEGSTLAQCEPWLASLAADGWRRLSIRSGEKAEDLTVPMAAPGETAVLLLEVSKGGFHLLAPDGKLASLADGNDRAGFKQAVRTFPPDAPLMVNFPETATKLSVVQQALSLSQAQGARKVHLRHDPQVTIWLPVKPDVRETEVEMDMPGKVPIARQVPGKADPAKGLPIVIQEDGSIRVAGKALDTDEFRDLLRRYTADGDGHHLRIHGGRESLFKHCRAYIKLAGEAKVDQIVFAIHPAGQADCEGCRSTPRRILDLLASPAAPPAAEPGKSR